MKFLLISKCGEGCGVALRLKNEGNEVRVFIEDKDYKNVFNGLIDKANTPTPKEGEIIFFDMSGNGKMADAFKKAGHLVYGASVWADRMEHDRMFGLDAMRECGIKVPDTKEFTRFDRAYDYIKLNSKKKLVFKPSGSMPCKLTYVPKDSSELLEYMKFVEARFGKHIKSFVLQEFVEGSLVSTEAFCDGKHFVYPYNHTVETKKFMNGDHGPSTGCSGNIVWGEFDDCNIVQEGVALIEELCVENDYRGQIDLNAVVNDKGVWGLEWTPRFGYDATPTFMYLLNQDFGKVIADCASGKCKRIHLNDTNAVGVRLTIPPYPIEPQHGDAEEVSPNLGIPIHIEDNAIEYSYLFEVMKDANGSLCHSGGTGVILCCVETGHSLSSCFKTIYKTLDGISVPDKQYRDDLEKVLSDMKDQVLETEYA